MKTIWIDVDGWKREVSKSAYAEAKLKQLREFGYGSLTLEEVNAALDKALDGKEETIIEMFIKEDLLKW